MHIYFFIQDISLTGGTERVTVNLSNLFVAKGHRVTIVSFNRGKKKETYQAVPEVKIVYLSNELYPIDNGYIARLCSFYQSIKALKKFFKTQVNQHESNVFIGQNFFANTLLWLIGKSKYVLGCEHFKYDLYPKPVRALRCFVYSFFKKVIVLTDKDRMRFYRHLPQNKVVTIPNMAVANEDFRLDLDSKTKFSENTKINPHSPYSSSKASADLLVKSFYDTYKMPINITRCSNNYGPYQFPEKLIPLMFSKCMKEEQLPVYGDGKNVRDWIYVLDHCKAIDLVLHKGKVGEIYNVGGDSEVPNIDLVKKIIYYLSSYNKNINEKLITYVKDRKGHDRRYAIDFSKIKDNLGFCPTSNFDTSLKMTLDWYLNNKDWLEKIESGEYQNAYKA